jgi:hypothetical protein
MSRSGTSRRRGLALIELIVLLALLLLFLGFFLAAMGSFRLAERRVTSTNNLKQISLATINCADTYAGRLPPGATNWFPAAAPAPGNGYGPCLFCILPFVEADALYKSSLTKAGGLQVYANWEVAGKAVKVYQAPGDPAPAPSADRTNYLANDLVFGRGGMRYPASITDGTANTIFFTEGYSRTTDTITWGGTTRAWHGERRWWDNPIWKPVAGGLPFEVTPPTDAASSTLPQALTPAGILVALGDGSARPVSPKISAATFHAACTPNGGEVLGADW